MPRTKIQTIFKSQTLTGASDAPRLDIERILMHVLGQPESAWLYAHGEEPLTTKQQEEFDRMLAERAMGKPLAYVLGEWEFYGRMFYVTEDVLVPRPETEELVEAALQYINILIQRQKEKEIIVADVGTGSGCIAVTLALVTPSGSPLSGGEAPHLSHLLRKERGKFSSPDKGRLEEVSFIATDLSPTALAVAIKNARRYGVEGQIEFLQGDMLEPIKNRKIDLIVSNPPYVPTGEFQPQHTRGKIETQGLNFEPRLALDGGEDGQRYIEQIAASGIPAIVEGTGGEILKFNI